MATPADEPASPSATLVHPPTDLPELFHYSQYSPAPEIVYTTSHLEADLHLSRLQGPVLGFDVQWHYSGQWDEAILNNWLGEIGRTALIQICDEKLIVLIHLKEGINTFLPPKLVDILQDNKIYKCGVQVRGDGQKLRRDFPSSLPLGINSLLELSNVARCADPAKTSEGNYLIWPDRLAKSYLGKQVDPDQTLRGVNWSIDLDQQHVDYAANSVYTDLKVFHKLCALAKQAFISLDLDKCSNNILPDGKHYRGLLTDKPFIRRDDGTGPDGGFLPVTGETTILRSLRLNPRAPKWPHISQQTALGYFRQGLDLDTIASECHWQRDTVELKLCYLLYDCDAGTLNPNELKRLIPQLRDEAVLKTFEGLMLELRLQAGWDLQLQRQQGEVQIADCIAWADEDRKPVGALLEDGSAPAEPLRSLDDVKPDLGARRTPPASPIDNLPRTPLRHRAPPRTPRVPGTPLLVCGQEPSKRKFSAVQLFKAGDNLDTIAFKLRIKPGTAQNYLLGSLLWKGLPDSTLSLEDVRRLGQEMKGKPKYELYRQCITRWRAVYGEESVVTDDEDEGEEDPEATQVEEDDEDGRDRKRVKLERVDSGVDVGSPGSPTPAQREIRE